MTCYGPSTSVPSFRTRSARMSKRADPATKVHLAALPAAAPAADLLVNLAASLPAHWERFTRIAEIIDADEERRRLGRERFKIVPRLQGRVGDASAGRDRGCVMDKAFSPADIETRIYARWEASGIFRAERPGAGLFDRHSAAQCHRHPAHGSRLSRHHHGRADSLSPHAAASTPCGSPAPIMRASPRKWWLNGN